MAKTKEQVPLARAPHERELWRCKAESCPSFVLDATTEEAAKQAYRDHFQLVNPALEITCERLT